MKANKPMTGEQLDELMTVAVNMQRDAETDCNRPSAMFAYAVQVAVLELRKVRNDAATLAAENAGLKDEISNITFMRDDDFFGSTQRAQEVMGRLVNIKTPATDAFLAEVRAQGVEAFASVLESRGRHHDYVEIANAYAAQLRKVAQS